MTRLGFSRELEAASWRSLSSAIINENVSSVLGSLADDVAALLPVEEQINTNIQPRKILTGVAKNQNVEMTKFESRNTTTRNHQNKAPDR